MGNVIALWVNGDVVGVDAEITAHLVADIVLVVAVFIQNKIIGDAVAATVFHHVASRMGQVHTIDGKPQLFSHANRNQVVVITRAVIDVVNDGRFQIVEDVPRCIVADPVGVGGHVVEGDVAHVATGVLKGVSSAALRTLGHQDIHLGTLRK